MRIASTRWRLLELQRQRRAVQAGADLLDRKREALVRALAERSSAAIRTRRRLATSLAEARVPLESALVEIGTATALGATTAQPSPGTIHAEEDAIIGVRVPRLVATFAPLRVHYGPGGTCAALDRAARLFAALLPDVLALAEEERAERNLRLGLKRTARTLNALTTMLLPSLDADIRTVEAGLEEDEREEAVRRRRRQF